MANFNLNKVLIGGRMTADPELKTTQSGTPVTSFSVAVNRKYTPEGQQQQADFFTVVAWQKTAEFVSRYFRKGSSICISGELQTRSWTDNNGQKRTVTEIKADEVFFVDSKSDNAPAQQIPAPQQNYAPAPAYAPTQGFQQPAYVPQAYLQQQLPTSGTGYANAPMPGDDDLPF